MGYAVDYVLQDRFFAAVYDYCFQGNGAVERLRVPVGLDVVQGFEGINAAPESGYFFVLVGSFRGSRGFHNGAGRSGYVVIQVCGREPARGQQGGSGGHAFLASA